VVRPGKDADNYLRKPDKRLAAVCGLFCPACTVFIGTNSHPVRLEPLAKRMGKPIEELHCQGCRTDKRCFYCRSICTMATCAAAKGIDFCGECKDYPCSDLKVFQAQMPHRIELWKSQQRIREAGYETWYAEMVRHFSCPACNTINSAYDLKCWNCGHEPGCEYVRLHWAEIASHPAKMK
jgi:hypothetical protein